MSGVEGLFARTDEFPNADAAGRLAALVGLDEVIERLVVDATTMLDPNIVAAWSRKIYNEVIPAAGALSDRTPLFVFAGDIGVGKTEVAEVLGQAIATEVDTAVTLYPLSLTARGRGAVGEMTTLLSSAFAVLHREFGRTRRGDSRAGSMGILLVDEADALAQSRELSQMHHEDRAGVNALLRGIDEMRVARLPVLTILCTNRLDALDPAMQRRAAVIETFERPTVDQRAALLQRLLAGTRLTPADVTQLADATGPTGSVDYGYTYSDLRQRLVPEIVLAAYRTSAPVTAALALEVAGRTMATRPFAVSSA
jgi:hypothetical protein